MKLTNKTIRIIPIVLFGSWFTYKLCHTFDMDFFFDHIILFFIAFAGFLILMHTTWKDTNEYFITRNLRCYIPTLTGMLFIAVNIFLYNYGHRKKYSPTLISGFNDGGYNGFGVDFKTDGRYVMTNGGGLGVSYFYGTYSIKDSIIILDQSDIDNCIKTNILVIRTENYYVRDSIDLVKPKANYITQIDSSGNEINPQFRFRVTEDNRGR
jgi:hypothetical protein